MPSWSRRRVGSAGDPRRANHQALSRGCGPPCGGDPRAPAARRDPGTDATSRASGRCPPGRRTRRRRGRGPRPAPGGRRRHPARRPRPGWPRRGGGSDGGARTRAGELDRGGRARGPASSGAARGPGRLGRPVRARPSGPADAPSAGAGRGRQRLGRRRRRGRLDHRHHDRVVGAGEPSRAAEPHRGGDRAHRQQAGALAGAGTRPVVLGSPRSHSSPPCAGRGGIRSEPRPAR